MTIKERHWRGRAFRFGRAVRPLRDVVLPATTCDLVSAPKPKRRVLSLRPRP